MPDSCEQCMEEIARCMECDKMLCSSCMMDYHGCDEEEE